jgi:hypothetical protein
MKDAVGLRSVSRWAYQAVTEHRWNDAKTRIRGSLELWSRSFPKAVAANIAGRYYVKDADFLYLEGVKTLDMCKCYCITDAAFTNQRGIHTLNMESCDQSTITDAAFTNLRGIHTLNMEGCDQETITEAAFDNLQGIYMLRVDRDNPTTAAGAFPILFGTVR